MNMRNYANTSTDYQSKLRDRYVEYHGLDVEAMVPVQEDQLDEFGDRATTSRVVQHFKVIPQYESYRQILNIFGSDSVEEALPLELVTKVSDEIPNDTIIKLPKTSQLGNYTHWRVLSSDFKHIENIYSKVVKCVPARSEDW